MPRIRTIKPEFPQSETIGKLSRDARLLFIQLWTIADDSGRARAASRMLASLLYPYDDDARSLIDGWLDELERAGTIRRYRIDGDAYLEIINWLKHQKIDRPSPSRLPAFDEHSRIIAKPREASTTDLGSVPGPSTGNGREEARQEPRAEILPPETAPDPRKAIFDDGLRWLASATKRDQRALRPLVGKWIKSRGDPEVAASLIAAQQHNPVDPISWIEARLKSNERNKPSDLQRRRSLAEAFLSVGTGGDGADQAATGETISGVPIRASG